MQKRAREWEHNQTDWLHTHVYTQWTLSGSVDKLCTQKNMICKYDGGEKIAYEPTHLRERFDSMTICFFTLSLYSICRDFLSEIASTIVRRVCLTRAILMLPVPPRPISDSPGQVKKKVKNIEEVESNPWWLDGKVSPAINERANSCNYIRSKENRTKKEK